MVNIIDRKYIYKHLMKAENELSKIAFPTGECKFVEIDKLEFEYIEDKHTLAAYNKNKLYVNKKLLRNKSDKKVNNEFVSVLQHELIHVYCYMTEKYYRLFTGKDSSPIFHSLITYFNSRGLNIKTNGNFEKVYNTWQTDLRNIATNINVNFNDFMEKLRKWEERLNREIENYNDLHRNDDPQKNVWGHFDKNEESSSTYRIKEKENGSQIILFDISFGMDLALEQEGKEYIKDFLKFYTDLDFGLAKPE